MRSTRARRQPGRGCLPILPQMPSGSRCTGSPTPASSICNRSYRAGSTISPTPPYYVLPAVLFISMFVQARLQPASVDSTQQKFLQYGMPIMFGGMALFFPSGLTLYMFTNNVLSALHSIYINKFDRRSLAAAAKLKKNQELAAQATAAAARPAGAAAQAAKPGEEERRAAKRVIDAKATRCPRRRRRRRDADDALEGAASPSAGRQPPTAGAPT
jgi:membrane protein insertase Oxa1/YidC/SpoIIIJ